MSAQSAREYAESIARDIENNCENGTPFGIAEEDTEYGTAAGEELTGMDWLGDVLDIEYIVSGDGQYRGARVLIAFGGPSAWVNTRSGMIESAWWSETVTVPIHDEFVSALDDTLEELWKCR